MEIYLIRHTTPLVAKGICYGQTDLDVAETFEEEVNEVKKQLPEEADIVFSSPLKRCALLAKELFRSFETDDRLKELNFGDWEMKAWDDIPRNVLDPWMEDFVNEKPPEGESLVELHQRAKEWLEEIAGKNYRKVMVVTHAGIIRVLRAHVNNIPLVKSFEGFDISYGTILKLEL